MKNRISNRRMYYFVLKLGSKCLMCGKDSDLTIHHIYGNHGARHGGSRFLSYLRSLEKNEITLLCASCHDLYHNIFKQEISSDSLEFLCQVYSDVKSCDVISNIRMPE